MNRIGWQALVWTQLAISAVTSLMYCAYLASAGFSGAIANDLVDRYYLASLALHVPRATERALDQDIGCADVLLIITASRGAINGLIGKVLEDLSANQ